MTAGGWAGAPGTLDVAITERAYEVVVLRLALGVLRALDQAGAGAEAAREELLALLADGLAGQR